MARMPSGKVLVLALGLWAAAASAGPVQLIIDTDMSTDVDDVAAVCMAVSAAAHDSHAARH